MQKTDAATLTGTVKWFKVDRGFIVADDGYRDVFCHASQIVDQGHELSKGERMTQRLFLRGYFLSTTVCLWTAPLGV